MPVTNCGIPCASVSGWCLHEYLPTPRTRRGPCHVAGQLGQRQRQALTHVRQRPAHRVRTSTSISLRISFRISFRVLLRARGPAHRVHTPASSSGLERVSKGCARLVFGTVPDIDSAVPSKCSARGGPGNGACKIRVAGPVSRVRKATDPLARSARDW